MQAGGDPPALVGDGVDGPLEQLDPLLLGPPQAAHEVPHDRATTMTTRSTRLLAVTPAKPRQSWLVRSPTGSYEA